MSTPSDLSSLTPTLRRCDLRLPSTFTQNAIAMGSFETVAFPGPAVTVRVPLYA